jgi:preprotein translocase subunit SecF
LVDLFRERKWDLVGLRNLWFAISLLIIVPGIAFWATRGLNYGIDFKGGGLITYRLAHPIQLGRETETLAKARAAIEKTRIEARVQVAGTAVSKDQLLVRTRILREASKSEEQVRSDQQVRIEAALNQAFPGIRTVAAEMVTPVVSKELLWNAVWSVVAGMVFILLWVWIRYHGWQWGGCALVALVHDVLVLIGTFAMTYREINSPFVAAALTVVGFSVHDTIVIFDRIRENLRLRKGTTFAETANISLLETMARSVNTVLTVELVLIAMYLLGGVSLRDFTFAMIVGVTVGAYSSIFNASQLMVVLKNREERAVARQRALAGRPGAGAGRVSRAAGGSPARPAARATTAPAAAAAARPAQGKPVTRQAESAESTAPIAQAASGARAPREGRRKLKAGRKRKKRF